MKDCSKATVMDDISSFAALFALVFIVNQQFKQISLFLLAHFKH